MCCKILFGYADYSPDNYLKLVSQGDFKGAGR
jgi:hypothetical protein